MALIEPKAVRWHKDIATGREGRPLSDTAEVEAAARLWMNWKHDAERLPVDFLRASLLGILAGFSVGNGFVGPEGLSHFRDAAIIDDNTLLEGWFATLDATPAAERMEVINHSSKDFGKTALVSAAGWGSANTVRWLLEHRADPLIKEKDGWAGLLAACWAGKEDVVALLLPVCEIDARTEDQWTPLHLAAANGHEAVVRLLMARGDTDARTNGQLTSLLLAVANGHELVVRALLTGHGANISQAGSDGIPAYAKTADHQNIWHLLSCHPTFDSSPADSNGTTPLMYAISKRDLEVTKRLLAFSDIDFNCVSDDGITALGLLIKAGWIEQVNCLLATGRCDPWVAGSQTVLPIALTQGQFDLAESILSIAHSKPDSQLLQAALITMMESDLDIEWYAKVIRKAVEPLDQACIAANRLGRQDVALLLIEAGADPDACDSWGRRAAEVAPGGPSLFPSGGAFEPLGSAR